MELIKTANHKYMIPQALTLSGIYLLSSLGLTSLISPDLKTSPKYNKSNEKTIIFSVLMAIS
jgi:hypothetical protein